MAANAILADMFRAKVAKMGWDMKGEATPDISYPTGFLNFDYLNGYLATEKLADGTLHDYYDLGITDGSYVSFIANTGVGKSTLACQIAANIARRFPTTTIFEDMIESKGLNQSRRLQLSKFSIDEYNKRYIIRNSGVTVESIYGRIKQIHDMKLENAADFMYDTGRRDFMGQPILKLEPTIYIIDSIAMLMPKDFVEDDEARGKSAGAASALAAANVFKMIIPLLGAANIILFGINHILEDVQMTAMPKKNPVPWLKPGERIPKGRTVTFLANNIVRLDNAGKLKPEEGYHVKGQLVEAAFVKSRSTGEKAPTRMVFDFANGFDPWLSLLETMKYNKLLYGGGASLAVDPEKNYKFTLGNFKEKVMTNPEFKAAFMQQVVPYLKSTVMTAKSTDGDYIAADDILNTPGLFDV
jgi:RecA/RadA recombinase